jgi:hypothetical protein
LWTILVLTPSGGFKMQSIYPKMEIR